MVCVYFSSSAAATMKSPNRRVASQAERSALITHSRRPRRNGTTSLAPATDRTRHVACHRRSSLRLSHFAIKQPSTSGSSRAYLVLSESAPSSSLGLVQPLGLIVRRTRKQRQMAVCCKVSGTGKRIDFAAIAPVIGTLYPSPFDEPCRKRERRRLGDAAGPTPPSWRCRSVGPVYGASGYRLSATEGSECERSKLG
jgi:hypothetical protein